MFEIGDVVKIRNDYFKDFVGQYEIIRSYMSTTHRKMVFVMIKLQVQGSREHHFLGENLEKDVLYNRKQKIKKICSKMAIE